MPALADSAETRRSTAAHRFSSLTSIRRRGLTLAAVLGLLAQLLVVIAPATVAAVDDTAIIAGAWTATPRNGATTNPGSTNVNRDGSGGVAEFVYNHDLGISGGASGSWDFHTIAQQDGEVQLQYRLEGLHAWFQVRVQLNVYVKHDGVVTDHPFVVNPAPQNCCVTPSNGFLYAGTVVPFNVQAGDEFGFHIFGSNGDSISSLTGTLRVGMETVVNGSFERPSVAPDWETYGLGSTAIQGWEILDGTVDLVSEPHWEAPDGSQVLDLDGDIVAEIPTTAGTIRQTVETVPGVDYSLSLQYSGNPDCGGGADVEATVSWDGDLIGTLIHDTDPALGHTLADFDYLPFVENVTATSSSTELEIASANASDCDLRHRPRRGFGSPARPDRPAAGRPGRQPGVSVQGPSWGRG